ncbi:phosphate regulon sensor histidine kinase PhoR [Shinella fusca]|jgi:two-component system phosphate regulon sensor histidine kinase PhoR|uniref:histidine kinase n=1 Tax=Shinella fusca TaxID=544480 RepID=A0A7W8DVS1_9HYPH|nr:phosphate regulon sensor histidine kinase PhoR [Shinella fusca]MBB5044329.1 two-component system phosphate regulon sensor histidine kinase PhoR [Shinella fusca]
MLAREWAAVTDQRTVFGWLAAQLWGERVLIASAVFVGFMMWLSGMHLGWASFAVLLLVIAGLLRVERRAAEAEQRAAVPVAAAPAEPDRAAEERMAIAAVLGALDAPALLLSASEAVLLQNRAAEAVFGPIPRNGDLAGRIRAPGILDMVREAIASGQPRETEHAERLPSETVHVVRIAPLADRRGEPLWLLTFRDVSQARRIERMRSDFVANASHELRTPLASLRGFIETLQGPAKNDLKAQERFLAIMHEQATRMSRLVDDLLSLSRLELRSNLAPDQTVDLVPLLGHVRDSLQPLAGDLGVEVALHLPDRPVTVNGDRDELVQVFENLIENACKYGQEGKRVDIVLTGGGEAPVELSVTDYGPGIPPEHVPRITERFYRVNVEASRSRKGTGLGLAIVKHILTRHKARLVVKSELGKGTVFTVKF